VFERASKAIALAADYGNRPDVVGDAACRAVEEIAHQTGYEVLWGYKSDAYGNPEDYPEGQKVLFQATFRRLKQDQPK
jgi:hypothetical protein